MDGFTSHDDHDNNALNEEFTPASNETPATGPSPYVSHSFGAQTGTGSPTPFQPAATTQESAPTVPQPEPAQLTAFTQHVVHPSVAPTKATAVEHESSTAAALANKSKRFLIAYMATIFSGIALLWSAVILGGVLFNQFFGPKDDGLSYFDPAGLYVALMSAMVTFGLLYLVASRYVAKSASNDTIGLKDWRVYKLVYAIFAALLLLSAASVLASLLYIPIAQVSITDDMQPKQILVTVLTSVHALVWIGLLLWQERLVKHGKYSWLQGTLVVAAALVIVVLTAIFPIGSKTNDRYDARLADDLTSIQYKISSYQSNHNDALPISLKSLDFGDDAVGRRLSNYTYTPSKTNSASSSSSTSLFGSSYDPTYDSYYSTDSSSDYMTSTYITASYELCADFKTDTTNKTTTSIFGALTGSSSGTSSSPYNTNFTDHKTGHVCFQRQ